MVVPNAGLVLDTRDEESPSGLVNPSPRRPNREDTGKAGCPNIEKAPGRWAKWANGSADSPAENGEAPVRIKIRWNMASII